MTTHGLPWPVPRPRRTGGPGADDHRVDGADSSAWLAPSRHGWAALGPLGWGGTSTPELAGRARRRRPGRRPPVPRSATHGHGGRTGSVFTLTTCSGVPSPPRAGHTGHSERDVQLGVDRHPGRADLAGVARPPAHHHPGRARARPERGSDVGQLPHHGRAVCASRTRPAPPPRSGELRPGLPPQAQVQHARRSRRPRRAPGPPAGARSPA